MTVILDFGQVVCIICNKIGWDDEFSMDEAGFMCVRCYRSDLNWGAFDNGGKL